MAEAVVVGETPSRSIFSEDAVNKWHQLHYDTVGFVRRVVQTMTTWRETQAYVSSILDTLEAYIRRRQLFVSLSDGDAERVGGTTELPKELLRRLPQLTLELMEGEDNLKSAWKEKAATLRDISKELSSEVAAFSSSLRERAEGLPSALLTKTSDLLSLPLFDVVDCSVALSTAIAKECLCETRLLTAYDCMSERRQEMARRLWKEQRYIIWRDWEMLRKSIAVETKKNEK